mgnify:CR=1 FL=1
MKTKRQCLLAGTGTLLMPDILITGSQPHPEMGGRYLVDIAREWGLSQQEAADVLGVTLKTVETRVYRARQRLASPSILMAPNTLVLVVWIGSNW